MIGAPNRIKVTCPRNAATMVAIQAFPRSCHAVIRRKTQRGREWTERTITFLRFISERFLLSDPLDDNPRYHPLTHPAHHACNMAVPTQIHSRVERGSLVIGSRNGCCGRSREFVETRSTFDKMDGVRGKKRAVKVSSIQ